MWWPLPLADRGEDIQRLKQALVAADERIARVVGREDEFLRVDKKLHLTFVQISNNPMVPRGGDEFPFRLWL